MSDIIETKEDSECVMFAECNDLECEELHPLPINDHIKKFLSHHRFTYRACYCVYRDSSDYYCENKNVLCGGCREYISQNHFRIIDENDSDHAICNSFQCLKDFLRNEIQTKSDDSSDFENHKKE